MNRDPFNRTDMGYPVSSYRGKKQLLGSANVALNDTVAELNANNGVIADKVRRQQTPTTGAADEKELVKFDFEEMILELADPLSALAEKNQDAQLAAQVELTLSALDTLADDDLEAVGQRMADLATADLTVLADYEITVAAAAAVPARRHRRRLRRRLPIHNHIHCGSRPPVK